ncbi:TPA: hypothetical protein ACH3X3_010543 [Trebouxia sp. C0006]
MTCEARDPPVDLTGPDLEAASCGSSKRSHRPADDIWDHFKKQSQYSALDRAIERGAPVNAADSMELCSTAEIVELFGEYYDADVEQQKNDYLISDSRTSTDLDFDHPALTQVTAPPPIARVQLGDNTEQYDLDNLVSKD